MVLKSLNTALNLLTKVETHIQEKDISEQEILSARLYSDMFPFSKQIQMISDNAKGLVARITQTEAPKYVDTETSITELKERLEKTILFVQSVPLEKYSELNNYKIVLPFIPGKYQTSLDYITDYGLPNLYFHVVIAYAILRSKGLVITKMDYINGLNLQDLEF